MKKLLIAAAALMLAACTSSTEYGPCIGALDGDEARNPALVYRVSTENVVVAILMIETVIVPVVVMADETLCPVARRDGK